MSINNRADDLYMIVGKLEWLVEKIQEGSTTCRATHKQESEEIKRQLEEIKQDLKKQDNRFLKIYFYWFVFFILFIIIESDNQFLINLLSKFLK